MRKFFAALLVAMMLAVPGHGVLAQIASLTIAKSTAYEASHVLRSGSGTLWAYTINNHAATNMYVLFFDATSVPSNGTVQPLYCDVVPALGTTNGNMDGTTFKAVVAGVPFTTGLTVAFSTNSAGCGSLTLDTSADGWFWAEINPNA